MKTEWINTQPNDPGCYVISIGDTPDEDEATIITLDRDADGVWLYWYTDYPEEGSVKLDTQPGETTADIWWAVSSEDYLDDFPSDWGNL